MITTLAQALPHAQFVETHHRIVQAPREEVWRALQRCRWIDLRWSRVLFAARGLWSPSAASARILHGGPVRLAVSEEGRYLAGIRVARPWRPIPVDGPAVRSLEELASFGEPRWLKFGLDFTLTDLADGRTLLETSTICQATDEAARRRFGRYWALIRPFSGLIRIELLATVARVAERG